MMMMTIIIIIIIIIINNEQVIVTLTKRCRAHRTGTFACRMQSVNTSYTVADRAAIMHVKSRSVYCESVSVVGSGAAWSDCRTQVRLSEMCYRRMRRDARGSHSGAVSSRDRSHAAADATRQVRQFISATQVRSSGHECRHVDVFDGYERRRGGTASDHDDAATPAAALHR